MTRRVLVVGVTTGMPVGDLAARMGMIEEPLERVPVELAVMAALEAATRRAAERVREPPIWWDMNQAPRSARRRRRR